MMKKVLAVLMCLVLVCSMTAVLAEEETVTVGMYEMLQYLLASEESPYLYVGTPKAFTSEEPIDLVALSYDSVNKMIFLAHKDEVTFWENVDDNKGMSVIYMLCTVYETIQSYEPEQTLLLAVTGEDEANNLYISNAETAAEFCKLIELLSQADAENENP